MVATPAIRNLIREGKTHQIYSAMQAGAKHGMQTMDSNLADLVRRGRVSYDGGAGEVPPRRRLQPALRPDLRGATTMATATYEYKVRDRAGALKTGKLEAETPAQVAGKLRAMGYAPGQHHARPTPGCPQEITIPGLGRRRSSSRTWRSSPGSSPR